MKNKKSLLSVLLAAVLLCACVAGMLVFGAGATESTLSYTVGEGGDYATVAEALAAAKGALADEEGIEITLLSNVTEANSDYLFTAETLPVPVTVEGAFTITANVATEGAAMSSVNDFTLGNFTLATNAAKLNLGGRNVEIAGATIPVSVALIGEGEVSADATLTITSGNITGYVAAVDGDAVLNSGASATVNYKGGTISGRVVGAYGSSHIFGTVDVNIEAASGGSNYGVAGKTVVENGGKVSLNINGGAHATTKNKWIQAGYYAGASKEDAFLVKAGGELAMACNGGSIQYDAKANMYMCTASATGGDAFDPGSILRLERNGTTFTYSASNTWYWLPDSNLTYDCDVYFNITKYTVASGVTDRMINKGTFNGDVYVTIDTTIDGWVEGDSGFTSRAANDSEETDSTKEVKILGTLQETFGGTFNGNKYTRINGGTEKSVEFATFMTAPGTNVDQHFRNCKFTTQYGFRRSGTATVNSLNNYFYQVDIDCTNFTCAFYDYAGTPTTNIATVTNTFDGCTASTAVYAGGGSVKAENAAPYIGELTNNFVQTNPESKNSFTTFYGGHKNFKNSDFAYTGDRTIPEIGTITNNISGELHVSGAFYADSVGGKNHKTGTIINNIASSLFAGSETYVKAFYGAGSGNSTCKPTVTRVINNIYSDENTIKIKEFAGGAAGTATIGSITNYVCGKVNLPKAKDGGVAFYDNSSSTSSEVTDSITNKFGYYYDVETNSEKEGVANILKDKYHSAYVGGSGPWYFGRGGFAEDCSIEHIVHNTTFGYNVYFLKGSAEYNGDSSQRDGNIYLADGVTLTLDVDEYSDYKAGDGLMPGGFMRGISKYDNDGVGGNVVIKGAYRFGRYGSGDSVVECNELTIEGGGFNNKFKANKVVITGGKFGADVTSAAIDAGELYISGNPIFNWTTKVEGDSITLEEKEGVPTNIKISGSVCINATEIKGNVTITKTDAMGDFSNVYVTAPAGSTFTFTGGKVVTNGDKVEARGWYLPISANLILNDRVYTKVTVDRALADLYLANFQVADFGFTFGGADLGINMQSLQPDEKDAVYYVEMAATGASGFDTPIVYLFDGKAAITTSISQIAAKGAADYAVSKPKAAALFSALVSYGNSTLEDGEVVFDAEALQAYAAEKIVPNASRFSITREADTINFTGVTLLMGDTIGVRLKADSTAGAKVYYAGNLLAEGVDYRITDTTIDLYINAKNLETILDIVVEDEAGAVCLDMNESVAHLVYTMITENEEAATTNLKLQATAMLVLAVSNYLAV